MSQPKQNHTISIHVIAYFILKMGKSDRSCQNYSFMSYTGISWTINVQQEIFIFEMEVFVKILTALTLSLADIVM